MSLDIRLKQADRVYRPEEKVRGVVLINSNGKMSHGGLTLTMDGVVSMQLSAKSVGLFEAFYNSLKPIQVVHYEVEILKPGKVPDGVTEIPFEFPLRPLDKQEIFETYHGVFINIQYSLTASLVRNMLAKNLSKAVEFIVEQKDQKRKIKEQPVPFQISPRSLENVKESALSSVPDFLIEGKLKSAVCAVNRPLVGELVVKHSEAIIKSIELQLVRVETCGCADGYAKEATEIQNLQVCDGDIPRGLAIPIYMIFPRLFVCPSLGRRNFKIEFEVNLVVLLEDGKLITENFPIRLVRP